MFVGFTLQLHWGVLTLKLHLVRVLTLKLQRSYLEVAVRQVEVLQLREPQKRGRKLEQRRVLRRQPRQGVERPHVVPQR